MAADTRVSITVDTGRAESNLSRLRSAFSNLSRSTDNASNGIDDVAQSADNAGRHLNSAETQSSRLSKAFSTISKVGAVALGALSVAAVGVGSKIVSVQREFDVLNAQLITATGSTENAAKAFSDLQKFASTTPYTLAQSVEGFAKLKNLGLDPSMDSMRSFGNTAAAMGKDMTDMIEAVADATTGEFERLKEFGIKSKSEGDKVTFTFQGVSKTIGKNSKEIQQYLIDIGNTKFAGAMDNRAKTLDGAISNITDTWDNLFLTISKGGIGDAIGEVVRKASGWLDQLNDKMQQPETVQTFKDALDGVGKAFSVIGSVIGAVVTGFAAIYETVNSNIDVFIALGSGLAAIATAIGAISLYAAAPAIIAGVVGAFSALAGVIAVIISPIGLAVAAIGTLVAAGVYLYRNWDTVKAKATEIWNAIGEIVAIAVDNVKEKWNSMSDGASEIWQGMIDSTSAAMASIDQAVSNGWQSVQNFFSKWSDEAEYIVDNTWQNIQSAFTNGITAIKTVVGTGLSVLGTMFSAVFNVIKTVASTAMNAIKALIQGDMQGVKNAFSNGFNQVVNIVKTAANNVLNAFKTLGTQLFQIGVQAVQGLANGIKSRIASVGAEARNLASNVANSIRSALDIHSPSRVTHALGEHAGQGLANGLKAKKGEVAAQAADIAKQVVDQIAAIKKELAMSQDSSPLAEILYNEKLGEYAGVPTALLEQLKTLTTLKAEYMQTKKEMDEFRQTQDSVNQSITDLNRQIALGGNTSPLTGLIYDLKETQKYAGASAASLTALVEKTAQVEAISAFNQLNGQIAQNQNDQMSPMAQLTTDYEQRLAVVSQYEAAINQVTVESAQARKQIELDYAAGKKAIVEASYADMLSVASGALSMLAGSQSNAYRALAAVEKGYALYKAVMNSKTAILDAYATTPGNFVTKAIAAAKVAAQSAPLVSAIKGLMPTGFKTGGYTGNIGTSDVAGLVHGKEYVLNAAATKRIGVDNLNRMNRGEAVGNNVNVIIENHTGAPVQQRTDSEGNIRVIVGQELKRQAYDPNSDLNQGIKRNFQVQRNLNG